MAQVMLSADTTVVGSVQSAVDTIQFNVQACAVARCDDGAQMVQKRLDLPPVNIAADRFLEDGIERALVLLTHGKGFMYPSAVAQL
jgi:hypothetical protein